MFQPILRRNKLKPI